MNAEVQFEWPRNDYSRVPNLLYHDPEIYAAEQKKIFEGPIWLFAGFEAEIPKPGDFRTGYLGQVPIIYDRDKGGEVRAFVNRCAHRGAIVRRELCGNASDHVCIYHQWCYDLSGNLIGVPFQRGLAGQGGAPKDFQRSEHGLRKLRIESFRGLLFASFAESPPNLQEYLGGPLVEFLTGLTRRPIKILGYQRQTIRGNWKLYAENTRDMYHASLLHKFLGTFLSRATTQTKLEMDPRHRHVIVSSSASKAATGSVADKADVVHNVKQLSDKRLFRYIPEVSEEWATRVCAFFPNAVFQQIRNSLATRQIRPRGPELFELFWTLFGYEDDSEDLRNQRLLQVNIGGPAGFISSEDGEAIEVVQKATRTQKQSLSVVEMGGIGPIPDYSTARHNDIPVRGFWSFYSELMGIEPVNAIR
jgi:anthranilate 1,2-dioxygenase large subunit